MTDTSIVIGLLVAALGGAGIGVERQQSGHASGQDARFAGIRTFTLIGTVAGIAGWLTREHYTALALTLVVGLVAIVVSAYAVSSRQDIDATTEVAALVAIAAGLLAGLGLTAVASGIIALTVFLLVEKSRLHELVARINDSELQAASRFAVMAVVVSAIAPRGTVRVRWVASVPVSCGCSCSSSPG
ncbi:MAG: MgtC/SapB family protein [Vicinamibacterales bacterium]